MILPIIDQFESILNNLNLKNFERKESLLREFLQSKIVEKIYQTKISKKIFFIGGTSLRLLRDLDRFSEDLDFDYQDLDKKEVESLYDFVVESLRRENIEIIEYKNTDKNPIQFEIRFPKILYHLKLRQNENENLVIKLDFDNFWKGHKGKIVVFDKFGFLTKVVTVSLNEILTQKIFALIYRKRTMARDIYDIVWLLSQGARIDWGFAKKNRIKKNLIEEVIKKIKKEKAKFSSYKKQIIPFLTNQEYASKIDFITSYFVSPMEIKFQGLEIKPIDDGFSLIFYFKAKEKKAKFVFNVAETAMINQNYDLPKDEKDTFAIEKAVERILKFYEKNPFKSYQTKLISTANLTSVFDFDEILE